MKSNKQCPKCKSLRIGLLSTQGPDDTLKGESEIVDVRTRGGHGHISNPFAIGLGPTKATTETVTRTVESFHELEAYICADCGYFESYVRTPDEVPWNDLVSFRWVNAAPPREGPYR